MVASRQTEDWHHPVVEVVVAQYLCMLATFRVVVIYWRKVVLGVHLMAITVEAVVAGALLCITIARVLFTFRVAWGWGFVSTHPPPPPPLIQAQVPSTGLRF
jgi:hypothetical protein